MRTHLDCIPCFLKLVLEQGRLLSQEESVHRELLHEAARRIPLFSGEEPPPLMVRTIQESIRRRFPGQDPYAEIKRQSNERALQIYPLLREKLEVSGDRLLSALEFAIAGNVIDYAAKNDLDIEEEIRRILSGEFLPEQKEVFELEPFREDLKSAREVLYLADNAGEIVFDRLLIEEIAHGRKVILAVRDRPILNDALIEDAVFCGVDQIARVMSSGADSPGTVLSLCSKEFQDIFRDADMVISKGQGNYEALSDAPREIYFLLKIKCPVLARHTGVPVGSIVLKKK
ncbi:MAG: DUF89 family protein [Elusimicrobia bacterium]|nr:DUF89 family protein [Elusimicrobiota bacterium]